MVSPRSLFCRRGGMYPARPLDVNRIHHHHRTPIPDVGGVRQRPATGSRAHDNAPLQSRGNPDGRTQRSAPTGEGLGGTRHSQLTTRHPSTQAPSTQAPTHPAASPRRSALENLAEFRIRWPLTIPATLGEGLGGTRNSSLATRNSAASPRRTQNSGLRPANAELRTQHAERVGFFWG